MPGARVAVIDDDQSVRESLPDLLREFGYLVDDYSSAEDFLAADRIAAYTCLILDISMPGMSGLQLQRELRERKHEVPIIFITAHGDQDVQRRLRDDGVECLLKPFTDTALLEALQKVLKTAP
jgi:FixJ family two-component response regulator